LTVWPDTISMIRIGCRALGNDGVSSPIFRTLVKQRGVISLTAQADQ
jgi:hypothetical protein